MTELQKRYVDLHNSRKGRSGFQKTHGLRKTPEYGVWNSMKMRCLNPNGHKWPQYGGRGIMICKRWLDFENFITDMGCRPSRNHSIDRIDTNGHYNKENCKWSTMSEQCRNQRRNNMITALGKTMCALSWSEETGIPYGAILARVKRGWNHERIVTTPVASK